VLAQRKAWFASELRKHPKTKAAKRRAALRASRRAYAGRSCGVFAQRATYFENRVKQAMREF
jgi:hypothetical protein